MKAQAEYTSATLARLPLRDTLLKEITSLGDAAATRVFSVQVNGESVYFFKRRPEDNIPKLHVRKGDRVEHAATMGICVW